MLYMLLPHFKKEFRKRNSQTVDKTLMVSMPEAFFFF